jgi:LAS superfamily LD-carboxypeptidase LdcB
MRPDVAAAFDRLYAAARRDGVTLLVTSAYCSEAEQARLFAERPDPHWVAPLGRSLHWYGTELDLGPPSAHGWLKRNAGRFHFVQRYEWVCATTRRLALCSRRPHAEETPVSSRESGPRHILRH